MIRPLSFCMMCIITIAPAAQADDAAPFFSLCNSSPPFVDTIQEQAQETVPALLEHGFDGNGHALGFIQLSLRLPARYVELYDLPCPDLDEPVRDIQRLENGMLRGYVVHNSRSVNSAIFGEKIIFSPEDIIDWSYRPSARETPTYGNYTVRMWVSTDPDNHYAAAINLSPTALPPDWN